MTTGLLVPSPVTARGTAGRRAAWTFAPRALRLLLLGVLFALPLWVDRRLFIAMIAWDAVLLAAWLVDLRRLPLPSELSVRRSWTAAPALGVPQTVHLDLTNDSTVSIRAWVTDLAGPLLRMVPLELSAAVPAKETARLEYDVLPRERGDAEMDVVAVRYRSTLGLAERWAIVPLRQTVRIYPDIGDATRETLALIRARQVAMEKRRARQFGLGRNFESLREFQQGDELRDVCWTATARRGRLVTRTYQPERSQTVWIVVDAGRLMRAREGAHTRLDRAVNAAFALAQVASSAGDRVGLLTYGRGTSHRVAPGRGAPHLRTMLEALATVRAAAVEADHVRAAGAVMTAQKRRALIVWLTDVAETAAVPEVIESAARMVPQHVLLFAVTRPVELAGLAGRVPSDARDLYRVMAAQEMAERRALLLSQLRQRGALAVEVPSAELTSTIVNRYLGVKERNLV
jgi:uncharacterized protein (DUF58 family)